MRLASLTAFSSLALSVASTALAVDTRFCPESVVLDYRKVRAFDRVEDHPQVLRAARTLSYIKKSRFILELTEREGGLCRYENRTGSIRGLLYTKSSNHYFRTTFQRASSKYAAFVPVSRYSPAGLSLGSDISKIFAYYNPGDQDTGHEFLSRVGIAEDVGVERSTRP
jgi:hypothetical protein